MILKFPGATSKQQIRYTRGYAFYLLGRRLSERELLPNILQGKNEFYLGYSHAERDCYTADARIRSTLCA